MDTWYTDWQLSEEKGAGGLDKISEGIKKKPFMYI